IVQILNTKFSDLIQANFLLLFAYYLKLIIAKIERKFFGNRLNEKITNHIAKVDELTRLIRCDWL
ncbi:MAG: hypothetical protein J6562_07690, partial [Candidatus Schmidhempelia sp.]|nr:hypothetical protein [Candidatus Schmidhempelia sp.]